ncbi:MAG: hypothetical protein JNK21_14595 [Rhodospirillaceae bacterium]|nr:hypothetical protein [Rhodospirillaceae bacterium]
MRKFLSDLTAVLLQLKHNGTQTVLIDHLLPAISSALHNTGTPEDAAELERLKANLAEWKDSRLEMFRSVIQVGQAAIKSLLLINGGATIAYLAFLGQLAGKSTVLLAYYASPIIWFVAGVSLAGLLAVLTYLSQACYARDSGTPETKKWETRGAFVHVLCLIAGVVSLVAFVGGGLAAYSLIILR